MSNHNLFVHGANGAAEPATSEQILTAARQVLAGRGQDLLRGRRFGGAIGAVDK